MNSYATIRFTESEIQTLEEIKQKLNERGVIMTKASLLRCFMDWRLLRGAHLDPSIIVGGSQDEDTNHKA